MIGPPRLKIYINIEYNNYVFNILWVFTLVFYTDPMS